MAEAAVVAQKTTSALTDRMHEWVLDALGLDPRNFETKAPPSASPPAPATPPIAGTAPPPLTPEQARADLERRLQASGDLYARYGQAADNTVPEKERLTLAEIKILAGATNESDRDLTLDGKDHRTTVDERGITRTSRNTASVTTIGADGKPDEFTRERTNTTNVGLGNLSQTNASKITIAAEGQNTVITEQTTRAIDAIKGEASVTSSSLVETKGSKGTTREAERTTTTVGISGLSQTHEASTQTGKQLESASSTIGVSRSQGQLGLSASATRRSGEMVGPAEAQVMEKGSETTRRVGGGLVSDDKGSGLGLAGSHAGKKLYGGGKSITNTVGGGGKCQALVREVPGSDPPRFSITTTISFDLSAGTSASKESLPPGQPPSNAGDNDSIGSETAHKGSVTAGATLSLGGTASFKRELTAEEAEGYLECIRQNGRGSKLPEHRILATGVAHGWEEAQALWGAMTGSADQVKALKPGEELEKTFRSSIGVKAGATGGETRQGGLGAGADGGYSATHLVSVKKTGMADGRIQVTAAVDESDDRAGNLAGSYGVMTASHGATHGDGEGRTVVFILDPNAPAFDQQLKTIDLASSMEGLEALAKDPTYNVASRTDRESSSDGVTDGAGIAGVAVSLAGRGTVQHEVTRDGKGKVTSTRSTGTSQVGGTLGVGQDLKVGDSVTESFVGEVKENKASGEIADAHRATDLGKTLGNLANARHDVLGAVLNPGKIMADRTDTTGTHFDDAELMTICKLALNKQKWNSQTIGIRQDDWYATGDKIRAAIKAKGGEIIDVDRTAVNRALAEWTKAEDGGRTELVERIIRPFGGGPSGKAFAFPDGTEQLKPQWDTLVSADPLAPLLAKAGSDPAGALTGVEAAAKQLAALRKALQTDAKKWAGFEVQHAEMLGHINSRMTETDKAVLTLRKAQTHGDGTAGEKAEIQVDLEMYNNNLDQMRTYAEAVFGKLWQAEQKLKERTLFSGSGMSNLLEASPWIKQAADQIKQWDALYWPTYRLWEKLSPEMKLDKAELEKLHVHGAQQRLAEVSELARKV